MTDQNEQTEAVDARLTGLTSQLEEAASKLKTGELSDQDAARLVEECARLAGEAGAELEQLVNAGSFSSPQQGELL